MPPAPRRRGPAPRRAALQALASGLVLALAVALGGDPGAAGPSAAAPSAPVDLGRVQAVADSGAPPTPTGVVVTPGDRTLTVRWNASTGATEYRVSLDGTVKATITTAGTLTATITGLTNGQSHAVTVTAVSYFLVIPRQSDPSAPMTSWANDGVPPGAPRTPTATAADRSAVLSWTAPADADVVSYQVLDASNALVGMTTAPTTTLTVTGLVNGTSSTFRIRATDQSRNAGASVAVSVVPRDSVPPGAPTAVTAVPGDRSAVVSWTAPADTDLHHYEVRTSDGVVAAVVPVGTTSVTLTGLVNGTTYTGRVYAVDTSSNSSVGSAPVTVTPRDAVPPAAPTGVTATPGDRSAVVRWTASPEYDVARYEVRSPAGALLGTVGAGTTSLTLTGLTNGTPVSLVVRAVDTSDNTSPDSAVVTVTPRDAVAPGAPTALTAVPADRRVTLSWTAPSDPDVVRYSVRTSGGTEVASVTTTSAVLTGLANGVLQTWVVVAIDSSGNASAPSSPVSATPRDAVAPAAPTAVRATGGDRSATLSWTPGPDTDLARYEVLDETGAVVGTAGAGASSAVVTGLVNGTARTFRVVAVDTSGNRSPASTGATATPRDTTAPGAPTSVTATPGDRSAVVRWTAPADTDLAGYEVRTAAGALLATAGPGATSVTLTGLTNGTATTLVVRALDTSGNTSPDSAAVSVTPRDAVAPGAPTAVTATPGDQRVTLTWTGPSDTDVVRYSVRTTGGTEVASVTGTTAVLSGLANGVAQTWVVVAVDSSGNASATSAPVTATPRDAVAPAAPTAVTATGGDRSAVVSWTPGPDTDLARYEVLDETGAVVATSAGTAATATVTGLVNGTARTFRVVAVDTSGNRSPASAGATATPRDTTAPGAPTAVTATAGDRSAVVRWTAPADTDLARYEVRTAAGVLLGTAGPGATSLTVTGLVNGTAVTLVVRAVDTSGNASPDSAPVAVTPRDTVAPGAPTALSAAPADQRVTLSWTAPSDTDVVRYSVRTTSGTEVASVAGTAAVLTGLVNGVAQTWVVVAIDSSGNASAPSAPVTATPRDAVAPAAPTAVTATGGDRSATLSWTPGPDTDLARYDVVDESGVVVGTAGAGASSAVVTGLVNGTARTFRVVAVDTSGNRSPASAGATATPRDTTAPGAPTAVTATPGDSSAVVRWTAPADTDLARYEVRTAAGVLLAVAGPGATSVTVTGLVNGTALQLVVRALDTSGNASPDSAAVSVTPRDAVAPGAPTALTAVPGDQQVALSWTAPADPDVARYSVRTTGGTEVASVTATTAVLTGLVNGVPGSWVVVAIDTSGNASAPSAPVTATPRDTTPPAAPTGVTATAGSGSATTSWTPGPDTDVVRFEVVDESGAVVATASGASTSAVVTGLVDGTPRTFRVVAVDSSGNRSPASAGATTTPRDSVPPAAPTAVTATQGDARAVVSWTAPADADLAGYEVRTAAGDVLASVGPGTTSVTLTGLVNGTAVTLVVRALDASGNTSPDSAPVTVTPRDTTAPAAPTALTATPGTGSATLSWTPAPDADVARYEVVDETGAVIATVPAGTATAVLTGLAGGTPRTFAVVAVDTSGNRSPLSVTVTVTPASAPPTTPAPTGVRLSPGDGRIGVTWTAVPGATSYVVTRDGGTAASSTTTTTGTGLLVTGLVNGREYGFTVTALVGATAGDASAEVRGTPVAAAATPVVGSGSSPSLAGSRDGRYAVVGTAVPLEASDTNRAYELYVLDAVTGSRTRIAPLAAGWAGTGSDATNLGAVALSDDGRYAVLVTTAKKVAADVNTLADVYRVELATGTWQLVSVPGTGTGAGKSSASVAGTLLQTGLSVSATGPSVVTSADGRYVSFYSERPDLVTGDVNGYADAFRKDMTTGTVVRLSTTTAGAALGRTATGPALAMTPDGRYAVFTAQPSSGGLAAFRKDATTGELLLVSSAVVGTTTTELAVDRDAHDVSISDDGRYVGFSTANRATTSAPATRGSTPLAYRKDVTTGAVVALGSGQTAVWEHGVQLDPSGAFGFYMTASGQDPADTDGHTDWYRTEAATGARVMVTTRSDGSASPRVMTGSVDPSEYGTLRALSSTSVLVATKQSLVAGDVNALTDVYAKDLAGGAATPEVVG